MNTDKPEVTVSDATIKLDRKGPSMPSALEVNATRIKRSIPPSWFTKKGPGVEHKAKMAFRRMDDFDRAIALKKGWFPAAWASLPFKPEARTKIVADFQAKTAAVETPNLVKRTVGKIWSGIKRLFGGK